MKLTLSKLKVNELHCWVVVWWSGSSDAHDGATEQGEAESGVVSYPDPLPAAILLRAGKVGLVPMRQNLGSESADPQTNQIAHFRILMK